MQIKDAKIFKALGDENRLEIINLLQKSEICAADILKSVSISQSTLSHHMKILCESGIVSCRRSGKQAFYSMDFEGTKNAQLIMAGLVRDAEIASKSKRSIDVVLL